VAENRLRVHVDAGRGRIGGAGGIGGKGAGEILRGAGEPAARRDGRRHPPVIGQDDAQRRAAPSGGAGRPPHGLGRRLPAVEPDHDLLAAQVPTPSTGPVAAGFSRPGR